MGDYVVITDTLTYKHPDSNPGPGQVDQYAVASLGDVLSTDESDDPFALPTISEKEAARGVALGGLTDDVEGIQAKLAKAGSRGDSRQSPYASLTSPVEQTRAAVAIAQMAGGTGPQSSKSDLQRLATADLQRLAAAFGAPEEVYTSDDRDGIIGFLKGEGDEAQSDEETQEARDTQSAAHVASSDFDQARQVGVGDDELDKLEESDDSESAPKAKRSRRRSAASESE